MPKLPQFTMQFEPMTIEHLGLNLYGTLPPVIGELVSNAWDADAEVVEVTLPEGSIDPDSEIIVRDYGSGMNEQTIADAYLMIGRNRRKKTGKDISELKGRPVMGRKGIGKLAPFGIATEMQVRTIQNGNAICIRLNRDAMLACEAGQAYHPTVIPELTGPTQDASGTEIRIRNMLRRRAITSEQIRRELARRFSIFGDDFVVKVNGIQITPLDRRLREDARKSWDVSELPHGDIVDPEHGWKVTGWVGLMKSSSSADRGIDVFARGKSAELNTFFGEPSTHAQFARAYIVGEIHAEFLDREHDHIGTGRNIVKWDEEAGQKLQTWGKETLRWVFKQWLAMQETEKREMVVKDTGFDAWLETRTAHEQRVARRLLNTIVKDESIDPESARPFLEVIKSNVEFTAFQELVDEIESSGANVATLIRLFADWRVIEAREHLRLSDGRLEVMEKLTKFVREGALEVQEMQPLFEEHGWLVDPSWGTVSGQNRYTELLRKYCAEPRATDPKDRRIDILGYTMGGILHVVEIKRPEKKLTWEDLDQIERYVLWARANLMSEGEGGFKYVMGRLIVGRLSTDRAIQDKMKTLKGIDIRTETYDDILHEAEVVYGEVERRLKNIAPEYSRAGRRARRDKGGAPVHPLPVQGPPPPRDATSKTKKGKKAKSKKGLRGRQRR